MKRPNLNRHYHPSKIRLMWYHLDKPLMLRIFYYPILVIYSSLLLNALSTLTQSKTIDQITPLDFLQLFLLGKFFDISPNHPISLAISLIFLSIITIGLVIELRNLIRSLMHKYSEHEKAAYLESDKENAAHELEVVREGLNNDHLVDFLRWKYEVQLGETLLKRTGITYPIVAFQSQVEQMFHPESILQHPLQNTSETNLLRDSRYRDIIQTAGRPLHNLPTYSMASLFANTNHLEISCKMGSYADMIETCDCLEWELLRELQHLNKSSVQAYRAFDGLLTLRNQLHNAVKNPIRSGEHRSVAVSLSSTIAYYDQEHLWIWLQKRSRQVAVHASLIHAIPSFMFQPATKFFERDYSIQENIYREYLEELFDRPDPPEDLSKPWRYYYSDPVLQRLITLMNQGTAHLYLTGVSVSLLNLRPEIHTLLYITDSTWFNYHLQEAPENERFRLNIEWASPQSPIPLDGAYEPQITSPLLFDPAWPDEEFDRRYQILRPNNLVPCAAAAAWFAVDALRILTGGGRIKSPFAPKSAADIMKSI